MTQGVPLDTWQEQLRRGGLDLAILLTVSAGPRYGLAIVQHLKAVTAVRDAVREIESHLRERIAAVKVERRLERSANKLADPFRAATE